MSRGAVESIRSFFEHLDPQASKERMAAAFATLAGGAVLSILGVLIVGFGDLFLPRPSWIRELGFAAAAGGLPLFLTGLAVALPSRWWERAFVSAGVLFSGIAVGLFVWWYPHHWHLTVQAPNGYAIGSYLAGMTFLATGTAGCLGTYLTDLVRGEGAAAGEKPREPTQEEIMEDLKWAEEQGWSWGGIRRDKVDVELRLKEDVEPLQFEGLGEQVLESREHGEHDTQAAHSLANLRGVQPERKDTDVHDQVGHLKQLKRLKAKEAAKRRESWTWKLTHPIQWLRGS